MIDLEHGGEFFPEMQDKQGPFIRDDGLRETMITEDSIKE